MKIDLHNHTTLCNHAKGSIEQYIDYVIDKHLNNSKDKITNPYKHLEEISNIEETSNTTTEFLGQKSSDYFETNALSGLDNF